MSEPFTECTQCGSTMVRVSPEDSSPLIAECQQCGHREYAEIQIPAPWPAETGTPLIDPPQEDKLAKKHRLFDSSGTPVSVGPLDEESKVIPFGWILIAVIAIIALFVWLIV